MDKVYFSDKGLTSTSANFIANQAKEYVQTINERLDNISFINGSIALVGGNFTSTQQGEITLDWVPTALNQVTQAYSLIAWLREAIKAKGALQKEIASTDLYKWCVDNKVDYPQIPEQEPILTKEEVIDSWPIKDRNHYLSLSTKVSVYGKFIHPKGQYSEARKELKEKINNPVSYQESGRDTIIKKYAPSVSPDTVDKEFFDLQSEWRKAQAELNSYEHKIQLAIDKDTNEKNSKFEQEYKDYQNKVQTASAMLKTWKDKSQQEIADLKIVIPDALRDIYNIVTTL